MKITLPSRFIAALAATAIALTTFAAAPAFAGNDRDDRAVRAIATILGLAVVGKIIHDNKKSRKDAKESRYKQKKPSYKKHKINRNRGYVQPRPLPRRVDNRLLPGNCLRSFPTRRGQVHMFGQRCLAQNYRFIDRLPRSCAQTIRTDRGTRAGYDARCLRQNGYRLARG